MTAISPKIEPRHLRLAAVVYVRQSTPQQLQNNQESTRRQYGLAERARQMGWPETAVRVIDDDLGMSGASSEGRAGFQRLVAAIGMGEVGIVLVTEVSRLSRLNSDWHRVIELCAVFRTLIADEDGVYCAHDPNDRLLLGVKGTLFAAELHVLQARMHGALTRKAERGELAVALPIGYRRRPGGAVVQDPDDAVRLAISTVFERFAALGNARAVLRHFVDNGLLVPRMVQAGPDMGRIAWERPIYRMFHRMLVNPAYAGTFVYGRVRREIAAGDPPVATTRRLPLEEWSIVIQGIYPAYISHETFLANRSKLKSNRYNFDAKGCGAARQGAGLLQGLVHCGRCSRQMGMSYGRQQPRYECRYFRPTWVGRCASPSSLRRSTRLSCKHSSRLCNQPGSRPHWLPCVSWGGSARALTGNGNFVSNVPVTRHASPNASTTRWTPTIVWSHASWSTAGRRRSARSRSCKKTTCACARPSCVPSISSKSRKCVAWHRTCRHSGMPTRRRRWIASACSGSSSPPSR